MTKLNTPFGIYIDSSAKKLRAAKAAWRKRTGGNHKVNLRRALAACN